MDERRRKFLQQLTLLSAAATGIGTMTSRASLAVTESSSPGSSLSPYRWTRARSGGPARVIRTPADLASARLILPFQRRSVRGKQAASKNVTYRPGAWPGASSFSGAEEGALVNNATADWLVGGDSRAMLIWAESHASLPHHWVDGSTGRMWSIKAAPKVSAYSKTATFEYTSDSPIKLDSAHYPSVCYVPYLATGDQFYLEELQFAANYHQVSQNPEYRQDARGLFTRGQTRAYAWSLRDAAMAYLATPDGDVPPPLLPKSYWKQILDNNRDEFNRLWVKNGVNNPMTALNFAVDLGRDHIKPWQQDWLGAVMGFMVWTGRFDDWRENYQWHIRQAIARASGRSGYPRSRAVYYTYKTPDIAGWADLATANGFGEAGNGRFPPKTNMHYAAGLRANLKIAAMNGIAGAAECFDYVDEQVTNISSRWAI